MDPEATTPTPEVPVVDPAVLLDEVIRDHEPCEVGVGLDQADELPLGTLDGVLPVLALVSTGLALPGVVTV